jgi:hypothetical protein
VFTAWLLRTYKWAWLASLSNEELSPEVIAEVGKSLEAKCKGRNWVECGEILWFLQ